MLCEQLAARLPHFPIAQLIAPPSSLGSQVPVLDDRSHGIAREDSDRILTSFIDDLVDRGADRLLVESDLARKGDIALPRPRAFVDDRVVSWTEREDMSDALVTLRGAWSGDYLNAFLCRLGVSAQLLNDDKELSEADTPVIADSVLAIVVSVFDSEAFVSVSRF
jgi:hypothetical protein